MAEKCEGSSNKVRVRSNPPLPDRVTDKQLRNHFRKFKVKWASIEPRTRAGKSKDFATVAFYSQAEAEMAVSQMNGSMFLLKFELSLQLKVPQPSTPIDEIQWNLRRRATLGSERLALVERWPL